MNIEQANKIAKEHCGVLVGFHSIPLPVYQVLVDYYTIDDDPFFPIQKALLQFIDKLADMEKEKGKRWCLSYISAVLGLDVSLVEECYDDIFERHLIYRNPETELLTVFPSARKEYLMEGSRPHKTVTGSIFVDGKTFGLFPDEIYESILNDNEVWASDHTKNITPHLPVDLSQVDSLPEVSKLLFALNSHQRLPKSIGLEHTEGDKFNIVGLAKKYLYGVYLVYIQTKDGSLIKIPFVGHTPLNIPSLSNVNNYTFALKAEKNKSGEKEIVVTANLGYNSNDESKNKITEGSEELWISLISNIYEISASSEECAKSAIKTDSLGNKYIFANKDLLINSNNPSKLLDDVLKSKSQTCITLGRKKFNEKGVLLVRIEVDNDLCLYLEIKKAINDIADIQQLKEQLVQIAPKDWRQRLVEIGQYSKLEEIDCAQYIHPLQ